MDSWPDALDSHLYEHVHQSNLETLVGGTLDFATPPNFAKDELLPALPNGYQVVLSEFGHTTDFWGTQKEAGTRLITTFYDSGKADASLYRQRAIDFTSLPSQSAIAWIVLAVLIGFALLAVIWLLVLAFRIRRRGGTGRKTGAWIRSVGPMVFGLGGWFLGGLLVRTLPPTRPLDDQLLAGGLDRCADLARGLRRLGPAGHAVGNAGQGHWLRGRRRAGRRLARFPRDERDHVRRYGHRCGDGRVEPEPARARHLGGAGSPLSNDHLGRYRHDGRAARRAPGNGAPGGVRALIRRRQQGRAGTARPRSTQNLAPPSN